MERLREDWPEGYRECLNCNKIKPFSEFHKHRACKHGINSICKICRRPKSKKNWRERSLAKRIHDRSKARAKKKGLTFNITVEDIQNVLVSEICPVLKIKMVENTAYSPSIDRIDSSKGYEKHNIQIISNRANMLKNNASIQELDLLLKFLKKSKHHEGESKWKL